MATVVCACGKPVGTRPEWAGRWIPCPACDGTLYAPFPGPKPAPPVAAVRSDTGGMDVLVLSLLAWMTCLLLSPVAWAMAASHEGKCRARGVEPSGAARAGKVVAILGTAMLFLAPFFWVISWGVG